jgi:multiple sugar transport system substrate-binding protein
MKLKKYSILFAALVLTLSIFAGCSKDSSSEKPSDDGSWKDWEGKITIWDGPRWADADDNKYHWLEAKKAEFEEKYKGVEVEIVQKPWAEFNDSLSVAIAGRAWPDIAAVDISGGSVNITHIEQGVVESIDDVFEKDDLNDFYPNALAAYEHEGKHYGIPNSMTVHAMLLNLDIFEEKGVEPPENGRWTYDEFVTKMKALSGDGVYGFSTYLLPGYYEAWPFLLMDGGYPLSDDMKEYTFDSPEAISGLQKLIDLKLVHKAAPQEMGGADVGGTWKAWGAADQRTVAVEPWATWAIAAAQGDSFKTNFMVAEYPIGETGEPVTIGGVGGWVMFKQEDADKKQMVAEFIKHLSTADEQVVWAKNYGTFPSRVSAAEQEPFKDNPEMARAQELTEHAIMMPSHPDWKRIDEIIQKELQLAANGEKTAEEALKDAKPGVEKILSE